MDNNPFNWQTLPARVQSVSEKALTSGALLPLRTECFVLPQANIRFQVRILSSLRHKQNKITNSGRSNQSRNPFLPYERDLFITDIPPFHVGLLNKFNVIDNHLLIVTRQFEDQEKLLTQGDFLAALHCLRGFPTGLVFYNGGKIAGASQRHKHLQLVPLPLTPGEPAVPIHPLLQNIPQTDVIVTLPELPFRHAAVRFNRPPSNSCASANSVFHIYREMLEFLGLNPLSSPDNAIQSSPYNLLLTREWMFFISRRREYVNSISINALGFAGAFLIQKRQQLIKLKSHGPLQLLERTGWKKN